MDELEESAMNAEISAEAMMVAAEAVLTERVKQLRRSQYQLSKKLTDESPP